MKMLVSALVVLATTCCPPAEESKKYPYMDGPMKIYWEDGGLWGRKKIIQLPGGVCYFREVRYGSAFVGDEVMMTEMECPEEPE